MLTRPASVQACHLCGALFGRRRHRRRAGRRGPGLFRRTWPRAMILLAIDSSRPPRGFRPGLLRAEFGLAGRGGWPLAPGAIAVATIHRMERWCRCLPERHSVSQVRRALWQLVPACPAQAVNAKQRRRVPPRQLPCEERCHCDRDPNAHVCRCARRPAGRAARPAGREATGRGAGRALLQRR